MRADVMTSTPTVVRRRAGNSAVVPISAINAHASYSRADYANLINGARGKGIESDLEAGSWLIEAKRNLGHRYYEAMIRDDLDWDPSEARRLKKIAEHAVLANRENFHVLPAARSTRYQLSMLSAPRLEVLIADGVVHSKLKLWQAENLVAAERGNLPYRAKRAKPSAARAVEMDTTEDNAGEEPEADTSATTEADDDDLVILAEDIIEKMEGEVAKARRQVERLRLHGNPAMRAMVANAYRERAATYFHLAEELCPAKAKKKPKRR